MRIGLIIFMMVLSAGGALADIRITEIMYNPQGSDTGREWIELFNLAPTPIDISGYRLVEGMTKRNLTLESGSLILDPYSYALLVINSTKFHQEYPGCNATVLTATFSLTNTGKNISLIDQQSVEIDRVNYLDVAAEGYSIEIINVSAEINDMVNWKQGLIGGNPGAGVTYPELSMTDDPTEPESPVVPADPQEAGNEVPEFSASNMLVLSILCLGALMNFRRI